MTRQTPGRVKRLVTEEQRIQYPLIPTAKSKFFQTLTGRKERAIDASQFLQSKPASNILLLAGQRSFTGM
jgi:hypothetical protein